MIPSKDLNFQVLLDVVRYHNTDFTSVSARTIRLLCLLFFYIFRQMAFICQVFEIYALIVVKAYALIVVKAYALIVVKAYAIPTMY